MKSREKLIFVEPIKVGVIIEHLTKLGIINQHLRAVQSKIDLINQHWRAVQ